MKFYKTFLFLFILNGFFVFPAVIFWNPRFLIPVFALVLVLDIFLLFFSGFYLRKKLLFSAFAPQDPYNSIFEELKNSWNVKNAQLLKVKQLGFSFFYFKGFEKYFIVLSEDLLERFSPKEIKHLLNYPFKMIKSGDLLFLTVLSLFLLLIEKLASCLNSPVGFFKKRAVQKKSLFLALILKILSLITKRVFKNLDQSLSASSKNQLALILWKLDSLSQIKPPKLSLFFAPLFLTNPLTDEAGKDYTSLQPLIKHRVKALAGDYPP